MEKNKGAATPRHDVRALPPRLEDLGVTEKQSERWQQIADIPEERFERHIAEVKDQLLRY